MKTVDKIGLAALVVGLVAAILPFVVPCTALSSGSCGDGQSLLVYPLLGLPLATLGFLLLLGSLIARMIRPTKSEIQDEEANS